jgi:5-methylcytosine-specific restriction endonuclease McrA
MNIKKKRRRDKLFKKDPYCTYCNCELIHPKDLNNKVDNMCTIDHIIDNTDPNKYKKVNARKINTVLSCNKCNSKKASVTKLYFDKIFLWKVTGRNV